MKCEMVGCENIGVATRPFYFYVGTLDLWLCQNHLELYDETHKNEWRDLKEVKL